MQTILESTALFAIGGLPGHRLVTRHQEIQGKSRFPQLPALSPNFLIFGKGIITPTTQVWKGLQTYIQRVP